MSAPSVPQESIDRWKAQDAAFLSDPRQWPGPTHVHVKTQPWLEGDRRFGVMVVVPPDAGDRPPPYQVLVKDLDGKFTGEVEAFSTVERLVEVWGVD